MRHEIQLADGAIEILQITAATFKTWKVFKIQFTDGRQAMLYKCGDQWVQRYEDQLDGFYIIAIGQHINNFSMHL